MEVLHSHPAAAPTHAAPWSRLPPAEGYDLDLPFVCRIFALPLDPFYPKEVPKIRPHILLECVNFDLVAELRFPGQDCHVNVMAGLDSRKRGQDGLGGGTQRQPSRRNTTRAFRWGFCVDWPFPESAS